MFGVSKILFVCFLGEKILLLLGKNAFNISNYVFLLTFYLSKNPEKKIITASAAQLFSILIIRKKIS